jgi:hypothetical protein
MPNGFSRYAGLTTAIAALAATAVVAIAAPAGHRATASATGDASLTDDDGGQPMFVVPDLAPGQVVRRCINVNYSGERPGRVKVTADADGPLARQLELTVARGTGGRFGDCGDFSGATVFRGSLAEAAEELGKADPWRADAGGGEASYRFTIKAPVTLTPEPDEIHPVLAWAATPVDEAGTTPGHPAPPPAGDPAPPADPVTTVATTSTPPGATSRPGKRSGPARPAGPRTASGNGPNATPEGGRAAGAAPGRRGGHGRDGLLETLRQTIGEAAKRTAFPLLLLIAMFVFVLLQNRLDRRDPKLALAPIHSTPDLPFSPLPQGMRP